MLCLNFRMLVALMDNFTLESILTFTLLRLFLRFYNYLCVCRDLYWFAFQLIENNPYFLRTEYNSILLFFFFVLWFHSNGMPLTNYYYYSYKSKNTSRNNEECLFLHEHFILNNLSILYTSINGIKFAVSFFIFFENDCSSESRRCLSLHC